MLIKTPLLHQSLGPHVFLSFSLYLWLIPWSTKAGCVTQGILASSLLSLSHRRLRTTRFQRIKGPTSLYPSSNKKCKNTGFFLRRIIYILNGQFKSSYNTNTFVLQVYAGQEWRGRGRKGMVDTEGDGEGETNR